MRAAGILLPVFALPDEYGIGSISKKAYEFVDFLKKSNQKYWQILPLGPTGFGDSPYQSFSTFAGNPYFIDVNEFVDEGLITKEDLEKYSCFERKKINYEKLYDKRYRLLRLAFSHSSMDENRQYKSFVSANRFWLEDYALFMALKDENNGRAWSEWNDDIKLRRPKALKEAQIRLKKETDFYKFVQYYFDKQWTDLKKYAKKSKVEIVGDVPIYVAFDSSDVWANPELFYLDKNLKPKAVAGCPPDPFARTGQLWGNPLYNWDYHKKTGFEWWIKRVKYCFKRYDVLRIDHFRGFDEYYAIPYGDPTAEFGKWKKGPSISIFNAIKKSLGDKKIIAEDLGFLTDSVRELVLKTGYPGMKVLLFAFDSDNRSEYLPHMIHKNTVIYTGTHDNETVRGWYKRISKTDKKTKAYFDAYTQTKKESEAAANAIRLAMASVSDTCIIPIQDYLNLGNEARINAPSTIGDNWCFKLSDGYLTDELAAFVKELTFTYGRNF